MQFVLSVKDAYGNIIGIPAIRGPQGPAGDGSGDMLASIYDPQGKATDIFKEMVNRTGSNRNLLKNWYFADPVNSRGQTEYTESGFCIDCWNNPGETAVTLTETGISFVRTTTSGTRFVRQYLENAADYIGKTLTLSVLLTDGSFVTSTGIPAITDDTLYRPRCTLPDGSGCYVAVVTAKSGNPNVGIRLGAGASCSIAAVKLEFGPVQTLAKQEDDGTWTLIDPIPDKHDEWLKCIQHAGSAADTYANATVLHSGNYTEFGKMAKPSGTYTGDGSSAERSISVGGATTSASVLSVINANAGYFSLIGRYGGFYKSNSGEITAIPGGSARFRDGILLVNTNEIYVNSADYIYDYELL